MALGKRGFRFGLDWIERIVGFIWNFDENYYFERFE